MSLSNDIRAIEESLSSLSEEEREKVAEELLEIQVLEDAIPSGVAYERVLERSQALRQRVEELLDDSVFHSHRREGTVSRALLKFIKPDEFAETFGEPF